MAKDGSSNVTIEDFEPYCQWKRLENFDVLEVHLPDFKKEQLRVRINNNSLLTISGERSTGEDEKRTQFHREFKLSKDCNPDLVQAKFGGRVLSLTLPKKVSVTPNIQEVVTGKTQEEASCTVPPEGKQTAENANTTLENLISGSRSSLSTLKLCNKTAAATVVAVVIVALGAYYLKKTDLVTLQTYI